MGKWKHRDSGKAVAASVIADMPIKDLLQAKEFINKLMELKKTEKLYDTYIVGINKALEYNGNGKVYFDYKIDGTVTGRLSCSRANAGKGKVMGVSFHTLPKPDEDKEDELEIKGIRGCFIAPDEDSCFITADQKAQELRIMAHVSGDTAMIKAFLSGEDLHFYTASLLFKKPIKDISKKERQIAKAISFLIIYGGGAFNLAETTGISLPEAESIILKYKKVYPKVFEYMTEVEEFIKVNRYAKTIFGRRRHLPNIASKNKAIAAAAVRQGVNFTVQSPATDINLCSTIGAEIDFHSTKRNLSSYIIGLVHDSIECISNKTQLEATLEILYKHMILNPVMTTRFNIDFKVPFAIDAEVGRSFAGGTKVMYSESGKVLNMDEILNGIEKS